jgi:hypothetical protein
MLTAAIVLFSIAAIFGFILIAKVFKNSPRPIGLILTHGLFASSALLLILIYVIKYSEKPPLANLTIFVLAALAGFTLFGVDMSKKEIPRIVVILHAGAAVIGHVFLITFISGS